MEAVQKTIEDLAVVLKSGMAEFRKDLQDATALSSSANPTSRLVVEFDSFRSFMLSSLQNLQSQVELLSKCHDQEEMRSRRKMLLVHGVAEDNKEDTTATFSKVITEHLGVTVEDVKISRCHRLGQVKKGTPRPILVKFRDVHLRDSIWYSKTKLKGSGITISEFLNKVRHDTFMEARRLFGVSKCWTRNGTIHILTPDGTRHRVNSLAELKIIPLPSSANTVQTSNMTVPRDNKRPKRLIKRPIV
ncbi:uncharacterized protein LOC111000859 [Pieris rapae]|uniref:uncharacterized protein LOC111000859 n=1 Tax=Pieris rapae TaxID=64459 RepID=UPI001E27C80C|nr:uncharacterized protein LOC111000859 [Pieris rapae]